MNGDNLSVEERAFRDEVEALKQFSGFVHDHLVTLLMTWDFNGRHCLLFPWAEKDLDNYWKEALAPVGGANADIQTIRWIAKQIVGMAGALDAIHNPSRYQRQLVPKIKKYGRHGDLKPENILWYRSPKDDGGILVIADLGLTAFNSTKSRSNIPGRDIPVTPGYRGPECDLQGAFISRSYDIWTFGCLLLEMCCWALGGQENRMRFKEFRTTQYIGGLWTDVFFEIEQNASGLGYVCGVKRQVNEVRIPGNRIMYDDKLIAWQWIAALHATSTCTQYFHELLDLIEQRMIIAPASGTGRIRSTELLEKLETMYRKVSDESNGYCRIRCPQKRDTKIPERMNAQLHNEARHTIATQKPRLSTYRGPVSGSMTPQELEHIDD